MLKALILKFSEPNRGKPSILDRQSRKLFLSLVHCLANDDDKNVRFKIGGVIELLIGRIGKDLVGYSLSNCLLWYKQQNLQAAAAQVNFLRVDVLI